MPNSMNDLTDMYGALNIDSEAEDRALDSIMKINSYLNNSLDLQNIAPEQSASKTSVDAYLAELVKGGEKTSAPVNIRKPSTSSGACNMDGNIPLSRILAQSYSYSSDSSASPHTPLTPRSAPQLSSRNSVFNYLDESPQSSGSSNYFNQNLSQRMRASTTSDPGSPTMEDAILMGCHSNNNNGNAYASELTGNQNDITIADLMNSLTVGGGNSGGNSTCNQLNNIPVYGVTRHSGISSPYVNIGSQPLPGGTVLGMQQPSSFCSMNHCNPFPNNYRQQHSQSPLSNGIDMNNIALHNAFLSNHIFPSIMENGNFISCSNDVRSNALSNLLPGTEPFSIEKAAKQHRSAAALCDATCTWSGQLPPRMHKNPIYSCKVFLGGVPWDVTEAMLKTTFMQFGNIQVEWPGKESSSNPPRGYVYILFEHEKQVKSLLSACNQDFSIGGNYYFKVSSRRMRQKDVQVIPWVISDSNFVRCPSHLLDPSKTVFVGALHGMLSAEGLANIMTDLFGGVVYAGIDTDKHKYPIGSGRVTFNNLQSYKKAVRAAFIEIKTPKFTKKVQVDPYLADSLCQLCVMQQGPYFCRDEKCFKYFCRSCWQVTHPVDGHSTHKPLMRNAKLRTQTTLSRVI